MIGVWIVKVLSISKYSDTVRNITRLSHVLRGEQAKSTLEFFFFFFPSTRVYHLCVKASMLCYMFGEWVHETAY